jgi:hypothetical protein
MTIAAPLDSASSWLTWSNAVYVGGAALTLAAAMHVLYEKRAIASGKRTKDSFISEAAVILAATVSLVGTIGAIHFGKVVSKLKDDDLAQYKKAADLKIAGLTKESEDAKKETAQLTKDNKQLQIDLSKEKTTLSKEQTTARTAESDLKKANESTVQFTQALAMQQQVMAQQVHTSPELNESQIAAVATMLKPFAGQELIIHSTTDTVVARLGNSVAAACKMGGITPQFTEDLGAMYQGVSVVVHADQGHPPLADILVIGLRQQGIIVTPASNNSVPVGKVAIYLGPQ